MKKFSLLVVLALVSILGIACPNPTSHAVVHLGVNYDYSLADRNWSSSLIGINGKVGWEEPNRFVTISAIGGYTFGTKSWSVGGEVMVNPLGVVLGYDTPINFGIIVGSGYKSNLGAYANVGLELSGRVGSIVSPFVRSTYDMNNLGHGMVGSVGMEIGLKLWLGRGW